MGQLRLEWEQGLPAASSPRSKPSQILFLRTTEAVAGGIGCPLLSNSFVEVISPATARKANLTSSSPLQSSFSTPSNAVIRASATLVSMTSDANSNSCFLLFIAQIAFLTSSITLPVSSMMCFSSSLSSVNRFQIFTLVEKSPLGSLVRSALVIWLQRE